MSVNARLKCTRVVVPAVQLLPDVPASALYTFTGKPAVAVSQMNETLFAPGAEHAVVGMSS